MLEKYDVYLRPFNCQRTLHIYLPNDYYQSDERYPVVYMFDGHNLFLDSDATYGKSWGLADFLDHYDKKLIIVGIECNHEGNERLSEYCPYDLNSRYFGRVQGKGIQTLDWLVYELKPMIDQKYRTYPFRECTAIAGSSMGAMVGAMYASGKMEECKEWLYSWDKRKMWELADLTLSRDGLVKGDRFIKELKQIIPDMNIEDLPVPYVAMATDIVRDQEVRFDRGSLHEAIRASISIPMLFRPLRKDGMVLIDGGILNPLPLSHVQRTEGDILIAVDVNAPIDTGKKKKAVMEHGQKIRRTVLEQRMTYGTPEKQERWQTST
mgnify:CR=1 FL=1